MEGSYDEFLQLVGQVLEGMLHRENECLILGAFKRGYK